MTRASVGTDAIKDDCVCTFFVHPDCQRCSTGTALLMAHEEAAIKRGLNPLRIDPLPDRLLACLSDLLQFCIAFRQRLICFARHGIIAGEILYPTLFELLLLGLIRVPTMFEQCEMDSGVGILVAKLRITSQISPKMRIISDSDDLG